MLTIALASVAAWIALLALWGGYWRADQRLPAAALLMPAFVYLFQKFYPFPWVNDPALAHWRGRGGAWKGRTYSAPG